MSYAAEDRDVAGQLAATLSNQGQVVWWDRLIGGGALWSEEISRALSQARAVVVLWSNASVTSNYVRAEARTAAGQRTLIPAMIEACEPPMPFGEYQTIDLTTWRAEGDVETIGLLCQAIDSVQIGRPGDSPSTAAPGLRRAPAFRLSALSGYWMDLVALATGPKTFLLRKWHDPDIVARSALFFGMTAVLQLVITLPDSLKLGTRLSTELQSAFVYEPMRMFILGAVVHLAWRGVGGSAGAKATVGAFVYVYSLMSLLVGCSQILSTGVLRMWAPKVADDLMRGIMAGRLLESIQQSTDFFSRHPVALILHLVLALWPLFVVPFVSWGAFRVQNNVSRMRAGIAAALSLILGIPACAVTVLLSYFTIGPG